MLWVLQKESRQTLAKAKIDLISCAEKEYICKADTTNIFYELNIWETVL